MQTINTESPLIIKAFKGEKSDRIPIWFMRQAGRYLPEYNEIRSELSFLDLTMNVDLACEVSIQPYLRFGLDAIIMFSDILTPLSGAGVARPTGLGDVLFRNVRSRIARRKNVMDSMT